MNYIVKKNREERESILVNSSDTPILYSFPYKYVISYLLCLCTNSLCIQCYYLINNEDLSFLTKVIKIIKFCFIFMKATCQVQSKSNFILKIVM